MRPKQTLAFVFAAGSIVFTTAGCGYHADQSRFAAAALPTSAIAAAPVRQTVPSASASVNKATYVNPVIDQNFPDPSVLKDKSVYYAYATNSGQNMPCERSTDLVHWTALPDAMPSLPSWAKPDRTWAPEVRAVVPGSRYVAYFAAWDTATNQQAVGAAAGTSPAGPFSASLAARPLVEQSEEGGAIDPSSFVDSDGSCYLIWKNDGNSRGRDTWIWIQKLSADGLSLVGTPAKLIKEDQPWEGSLIEAPTLWKHGGKYYLFYSANNYSNCSYAVGYAVSSALKGPYTKPCTKPWLSSTADVCGPGGEDIVTSRDGSTWMAYHTWAKGPNSYRSMSIDALHWNGDVPVLVGPSHSPEPAPH